ncbi:hypothetical protein SISNIDRAFT_485743 [Sistotremastrum niveocremeum HHB9708]|uniref:Asl1-like glycosyl hydrolase catalytic domain-containing protein n=1 Tax=Sistotremastrum niveocremeum HHB9708 TaxID=1314777 RepID=A0A164USL5_9AGAM|nr:hypothetical protein SISNIDRAFT_485743 [Sistotremastrum niveocremeum HHB9708]
MQLTLSFLALASLLSFTNASPVPDPAAMSQYGCSLWGTTTLVVTRTITKSSTATSTPGAVLAVSSSHSSVPTTTSHTSTVVTSTAHPTSTVKVVTPTTSSSTPAATKVASVAPLKNKKGLSFNNVAATTPFVNAASWAYNWDKVPGGTLSKNFLYVPMLWGADSGHTANWISTATTAIANGAEYLLGFNEPDLSSQSNLTPAQAAAAWKTYMQPFAGKVKLISPAITNGFSTTAPLMGTPWMDAFLAACTGCTIDGIAMHIYDSATNVAYYKNYITSIGTKYGKPVWVTEFGASGTTAQQQTFLETMLPFLDNLSSVQAYAYFGDLSGILVNSDNSISPLGQTYASA